MGRTCQQSSCIMQIPPTRISLCSKNCMMTFRRYSKLTSSSDFTVDGDEGLEDEFSFAIRSDTEDVGDRTSGVLSLRDAQYPTPGPRCFSSSATEDWTFRSSSRNVWPYMNNEC